MPRIQSTTALNLLGIFLVIASLFLLAELVEGPREDDEESALASVIGPGLFWLAGTALIISGLIRHFKTKRAIRPASSAIPASEESGNELT